MKIEEVKNKVVKTSGEAAKLLGVSVVTMAEWAKKPGFPGRKGNGRGGGNGRYDIEEIRRWRAGGEFSKPAVVAARSEIIDGAEYKRRSDAARLKELESNAGLAELELEREAGRILDREDVERFEIRKAETAKTILEEIPDRFDARLPQSEEDLRLIPLGSYRDLFRTVAMDSIREALNVLAEQMSDDQDDAEDAAETE